jgi:hypothetical protein
VDGEYGWAMARDRHHFTQLLQAAGGGETWSAARSQIELVIKSAAFSLN